MNRRILIGSVAAVCLLAATAAQATGHGNHEHGDKSVRRVLLISIDGMHALDLANCIAGGTCPNLAALAGKGITYPQASSSRPSDSFPGLLAIVTGGSPKSADIFYDDSYDRVLAPPLNPNNGINNSVTGTACVPGVHGPGTEIKYDESLDANWDPNTTVSATLDGGGSMSTINMARDPMNGCNPVFPHQLLRVNTIFEVIRKAGHRTAWSDKHRAYDLVNGPSGKGVDDLFTPEINSAVPASGIPGVTVPGLGSCSPAPDPGVAEWTSSFADIKCYDQLKVNAILNEIDGFDSSGATKPGTPTILGMNFQAVSVGEKLFEKSTSTKGGYQDALGTPTAALLGEIEFVDGAIGQMVSELESDGLSDSTLIIISAKHGQAPIDPNLVNKPGDVVSPVLSSASIGVPQITTDDVALIWLADQSQTTLAASELSASGSIFLSELFAGPSIKLLYNDPATDSRTPDIIVTPTNGTIYTGSKKKNAEHGGFGHDDTNVLLLVSNPGISGKTVSSPVETAQIAPTILKALGLDPDSLQAVQQEHTQVLPGISFNSDD
jgi:hypothetical protein